MRMSCITINNEDPVREMSYQRASARYPCMNPFHTPLKRQGCHHLYCDVSSAPEMGPPIGQRVERWRAAILEDEPRRLPMPRNTVAIPMRALEYVGIQLLAFKHGEATNPSSERLLVRRAMRGDNNATSARAWFHRAAK